MQNHIYRHIDTTPYSCYYCGHKSTTKSTIMVHIELCHPNMEVKIKESRVKEEDYYLDLNAASSSSSSTSTPNSSSSSNNHNHYHSSSSQSLPPPPLPPLITTSPGSRSTSSTFEIIQSKCQQQPKSTKRKNDADESDAAILTSVLSYNKPASVSSHSISPSLSTSSSLCSSPAHSPQPSKNHSASSETVHEQLPQKAGEANEMPADSFMNMVNQSIDGSYNISNLQILQSYI